ncbi:MAG: hypothetical protein AAB815_03175 [Patescibacteria group bacterium]
MKRIFLLALAIITMAIPACANDDTMTLPASYAIAKGSNLYEATAALCGTNSVDEQNRGRWRRWLSADPILAKAQLRQSKSWGTIAIVQPGTYNVPQDLCADEAQFPWVALIIGAGVLAVVGVLARREWQERNHPQPSLARG